MSIKNALKIIQSYREDGKENFTNLQTLNELVDLSEQQNLPCTIEELKKAFQIDWDLRWLKYRCNES